MEEEWCIRCQLNQRSHGSICIKCHRDDVRKRYQADKKKYQYLRAQSRIQKKIELIKFLGGKCKICDIECTDENWAIFDFHHRDPSQKEYLITRSNFKNAEKEILKCDLLCANCHRIIHSTYKGEGND